MSIAVEDLPKVIIIEPGRGVRMDIRMDTPALEIEAHLDKEGPGKSFILMLGHSNGEVVQRVRVAGHTKVLFDPESPGEYVVLLTNPMAEPAIVHWEVRPLPGGSPTKEKRSKSRREPDPAYR